MHCRCDLTVMRTKSSTKRTSLVVWIKIIVIVLLSVNWYLLDNYMSSFGLSREDAFPRKVLLAVAAAGGAGTFYTLLILRYLGKTRDELEVGFELFWGILDTVTGWWILIFMTRLSPQIPLDEMLRDGRVQFVSGMNFIFAGMLLLGDAITYMANFL